MSKKRFIIEKHTIAEYVVLVIHPFSDIKEVIAKCPSEGIALTIKGLYENADGPKNE